MTRKDPLTDPSRREFLTRTSLVLLGLGVHADARTDSAVQAGRIIDIHQHVGYSGRSDDVLLSHQRAMGIATSILLPAGRPANTAATHYGESNGLQAQCLGNEACSQFAKAHPKEFLFGANDVPDAEGAAQEIEKYLKLGAVMIAEQKFGVECDSLEMQKIYQLAQAYDVPVLMHWQFKMYNYGFERFYKMVEKYPRVNFIGHAQTWWANIDKNCQQEIMYPKGPVTPGGITDRLLSEYPNMYGDLSAGSGLNALTRDEDHARNFLERHQNKLLYGSDCSDRVGTGPECSGSQQLATLRRLAPAAAIPKMLYGNASRLLRIA